MKDPLKKHIEKNRTDFDIYQFDMEESWMGISSQLDNSPQRKSVLSSFMKIAATVLIIITVGFSYYLGKRSVDIKKEGIALHNISSELAETEAYYINLIDDKMDFISKNKTQIDEDIWESLHQLDMDYVQLKKDLTERADSDEVIEAMIGYYRLKLDMLEQISKELKEKRIEDEKVSI